MRKWLYLIAVFWLAGFLVLVVTNNGPAENLVRAAATPIPMPLPAPGRVTSITTIPPGGYPYHNVNKMGRDDYIWMQIDNSQGGQINGTLYSYPSGFLVLVDLQKGDGGLIPGMTVGISGMAPLTVEIPALNIRKKNPTDPSCYVQLNPECSRQWGSLLNNPLVAGPVTLKKIEFRKLDENGQVTESTFQTYDQKLATIANPPNISSLNKSSAQYKETVTINGSNFDTPAVTSSRFRNQILFDLDRNTSSNSRVLNWVGLPEDVVHYCVPDKIKFDMAGDIMVPPDVPPIGLWKYYPMPTGAHTITVLNDYGYSNTVPINLGTGAAGTPEDDPLCANPSGSITSIQPPSGPPGTILTINGSGFGVGANYYKENGIDSANYVYIGSYLSGAPQAPVVGFNYESYTDQNGFKKYRITQLRVEVPQGASTGKVSVTPSDGYTFTGPVFTVTSGQATTTPTPPGGGGTGGGGNGGEAEEVSVTSIFPNTLNRNSENVILVAGTGFNNPEVTSDDPETVITSIEFSNDEKTALRVTLEIGNTSADSAQIIVTDEGGTDFGMVELVDLLPGAPEVSGLEITDLDQSGQAKLVVNGENLAEASVEVLGIQATVENIEFQDENQLLANLQFSPFYSQKPANWLAGLIKTALAFNTNNGVVVVTNNSGARTTTVEAAPITSQPPPREGQSSQINFDLTKNSNNPLKGRPTTITSLINVIAGFIFDIAVPLAVIIIIYGGLLMLLSGGDPGKYKKGLDALKYASIGLAILLIGKGFVSLIQSILGVKK